MNKLLIILLFVSSSLFAQKNVGIFQVKDSTTNFGISLPVGQLIHNKQDGKIWELTTFARDTIQLYEAVKKQYPNSIKLDELKDVNVTIGIGNILYGTDSSFNTITARDSIWFTTGNDIGNYTRYLGTTNDNDLNLIRRDTIRLQLDNITSNFTGGVKIATRGTENGILLDKGEWDDLAFPATTQRQGVSQKPDFSFTQLGLLFPNNDTTENISIVAQMPHSWEYGTSIVPHVHWIQSSSDSAVFKMKYRIYNIGDPVPTVWKTLTTTKGEMPYTSGSIHQMSNFGVINMTGKTASCNIDIVVYRIADPVSGDVLVKFFDIHFRKDKLGNTTDYTK